MKTIKEVFDSKYFQGITSTDEEAYNLCKEEMTTTAVVMTVNHEDSVIPKFQAIEMLMLRNSRFFKILKNSNFGRPACVITIIVS